MLRNIIRYFLFLNLLITSDLYSIKTVEDFRAKHITETIFGKHGAQLSKDHKALICSLVHDLLVATPFQKKEALYRATRQVAQEVIQRRAIVQDKQNKAVDLALFILAIQEEHLREVFLEQIDKIHYKDQVLGSLAHYMDKIVVFFKSFLEKKETFIDQLAQYLFIYTIIEREHIFCDYQKTLYFFSAIKKTYFPEIIFFWEDHYAKGRLLKMIKDNHQSIKVQMLSTVAKVAEVAAEDVLAESTLTLAEDMLEQTAIETVESTIVEDTMAEGILESVEGSLVSEVTDAGESVAEKSLLDVMKQEAENGLEDNLEETVEGSAASQVEAEAEDAGESQAQDELEDEVEEQTEKEAGDESDTEDDDAQDSKETEQQRKSREVREERARKKQEILDKAKKKKESSVERRKKWQEKRSADREKLKQDWEASKTDTRMGKIKKMKLGMRYRWSQLKSATGLQKLGDIMHDYVTGPIGDWYKTSIYERFVAPLEDNALKRGMDKLPGWMRMAADMTIQMGIMQAGGMVAFWTQQDLAEIYRNYAETQKQLAGINTQVSSTLEQKLITLLKFSGKTFSANTSLLDELHADILSQAQYEAHYRQKALLKMKPKHYFVVAPQTTVSGSQEGPMSIDERFLDGAMFTPFYKQINSVYLSDWYNIFRVGNWQYMVDDDLFAQFQTVRLNESTALLQGQQALYNSIFTEYIPPITEGYTIVVECSLEVISYPYLCGIIFNSARWISGVVDNYHKHRFCGFFGSSDKKNYAVLEESIAADGTSNPRVQWPAYMIFSTPANYQQQPVTLSALPLSYRFTITTQKNLVTVMIEPLDNEGKAGAPLTLTKKNCDTSMFLYHSIGFMSAGCSATFKIKEPTDLVYSVEQKNAFKALLAQ